MWVRVPIARRLAVGLLAAGLLAGCGEDKLQPQRIVVDPRPPEAVVPLSATVAGFTEATAQRSCAAIAGLVHSVYPPPDDASCRNTLRRLGGFRSPVAQAYGSGAVIDFETARGAHRAVVLALDANRRYRMLFIVDVSHRTIGTALAPSFEPAARAVTRAIVLSDCGQFIRLADREFGAGTGSPGDVCDRLPQLGVSQVLGEHPRTQPQPLGGNRYFAFFGLRTGPREYYTMVMARQPLGEPRVAGRTSARFATAVPS